MSLTIKKIPKPKDENLELKELNPMLMKYFTNTLFIAPTGVGKTNLIINLLDRPRFYKNKFDKIVLFSNTYYSDNIWKSCKSIDEENVYIDYSDDVLEQIIEEQIASKNDEEPLNTLIIFDDIIQQISKHKSLINKLIMRNRHYYLTIWITTQKYSLVSPTIRNNTAYFVLFGIKNKKEKEFIINELSDNVNEEDFTKMWSYALDDKNYNFLVISVKDPPNKMYRKQFKSFIELKDQTQSDKNYMVNSYIFPKDDWNVTSARNWMKEHKQPKERKVAYDRPNFITFQINTPEHIEKSGYTKYRTKTLPNGVQIITAYKD
jgi:hypothetical protein